MADSNTFGKPEGNAINKARTWLCVLYPENMREDWREVLDDLIPLPYAYCIHDKDKDGHDGDRKMHVHFMLVFKNTTTYKHACEVYNLLSAPGKRAFNTVQACLDVRRSYDYLIHDTDNARKKKKYQYPKEERIEGNNFDIGAFEQIDQATKDRMCEELCDFVIDGGFKNMRSLYVAIKKNFDSTYFPIFKANNAMLARLCKGNFQDDTLRKEESKRPGIQDFEKTK